MNIIANVFHPAAQVTPAVEDLVRKMMLRERGLRDGSRLFAGLQFGHPHPKREVDKQKARPRPIAPAPQNRQPVTIRGETYASISEAADALGINASTVAAARRRGQVFLDRCGLGAESFKRRPVTVRGVWFDSVKSAAEACGVSETTIIDRRKKGTLDELQPREAAE